MCAANRSEKCPSGTQPKGSPQTGQVDDNQAVLDLLMKRAELEAAQCEFENPAANIRESGDQDKVPTKLPPPPVDDNQAVLDLLVKRVELEAAQHEFKNPAANIRESEEQDKVPTKPPPPPRSVSSAVALTIKLFPKTAMAQSRMRRQWTWRGHKPMLLR